jgi:hypothetical protein
MRNNEDWSPAMEHGTLASARRLSQQAFTYHPHKAATHHGWAHEQEKLVKPSSVYLVYHQYLLPFMTRLDSGHASSLVSDQWAPRGFTRMRFLL